MIVKKTTIKLMASLALIIFCCLLIVCDVTFQVAQTICNKLELAAKTFSVFVIVRMGFFAQYAVFVTVVKKKF